MVTTAVLVPAWHVVHGVGILTHLCVRGEGVVWCVCVCGMSVYVLCTCGVCVWDECVCVVYMRCVCVYVVNRLGEKDTLQ